MHQGMECLERILTTEFEIQQRKCATLLSFHIFCYDLSLRNVPLWPTGWLCNHSVMEKG